MTVPRPASPRSQWLLVLLVVWGASAAYTLLNLDRGWVPHDDGLLAQAAERVLRGEVPHRDFDETYTGGLDYLHAIGLAVFGTNLLALRAIVFLFFGAWIPALYYVASRFASPVVAGLTVLLAVAWSLPNYPAAVPSWYNLFFATFGTAALLRYLEAPEWRWLALAGLCGGLSFLVKLAGLYYVAGALLFLLFHEQVLAAGGDGPRGRLDAPVYQWVLRVGLAALIAVLVAMVWGRSWREFVHLALPGVVVAGLVLWHEGTARSRGSPERFARLLRLVAPFLAGVAVPVLGFAIPYAAVGAFGDLINGVFRAPAQRLAFASTLPPPVLLSLFAGLPLILFLQTATPPRPWQPVERLLVVLILGTTLFTAAKQPFVYQLVWHSIRAMMPVGVVVAAVALARVPQPAPRQRLALLLLVTAMAGLVQFPFSSPIYFCYVAPLIVLTALALLSVLGRPSAFAPGAAWGFYLGFALLLANPGTVYYLGFHYWPNREVERLALERGGVRVSAGDKATYEQLVTLITRHARSDVIYATPDCPEVYFLSGKRNPTRHVFEFLSRGEFSADSLLATLSREGVTVVVLNGAPEFSGEVTAGTRAALREQYPDSAGVGEFVVRWRS